MEVNYEINGNTLTLTGEYMDYIEIEDEEIEVEVREILYLEKVDDSEVEYARLIDEITERMNEIYDQYDHNEIAEEVKEEYERLEDMLYW